MAQELKILGKIGTISFLESKTCITEFDVVIIDTNILIDSPECILEISKHTKVIIPVQCVNELNIVKGKNYELNDKVNYSLRMIKELKSTGNNYSVVDLSSYARMHFNNPNDICAPQISDVDYKIIHYAKYLYNNLLAKRILILSKDTELKFAAEHFNCCCTVGDYNSYYIPREEEFKVDEI